MHAIFVVEKTLSYGRLSPKLKKEVVKLGEDLINQVKSKLNGVKFKSAIVEGEPAREIVEYARGMKADLIVMPTSGLCRTLLESTTEKVIRNSGIPVLTLYAPD